VTLHQLSQACVFINSSHGSGSSPHSCGVFLPPPLLQAFPLMVAWCAAAPAFSSWLVMWNFPSLLLRCSGYPPSLLHVFFVFIAYYSGFFSFFPLGGGLVCPGDYADLSQDFLWEYRVPLSSLSGPCFPKLSGCCHLASAWEASWFLHLTWSGDAMCRLEVWRSQSFASSQFFSCRVHLRHLSKILL
jgi:hypothetical protein